MKKNISTLFSMLLCLCITKGSDFGEIMLHLDRDVYAANEIIWFKAYYQDNDLNKINSRIFVELRTSSGEVINDAIYNMKESQGVGSLRIPSKIVSGFYYVNLYIDNTPQLKKTIEIYIVSSLNLRKNQNLIGINYSLNNNNLIGNVENEVVIHSKLKDTVHLVSNATDTINSVIMDRVLTLLKFIPKFNHSYSLVSNSKKTQLPSVKTGNFVFSINNIDDSLYLKATSKVSSKIFVSADNLDINKTIELVEGSHLYSLNATYSDLKEETSTIMIRTVNKKTLWSTSLKRIKRHEIFPINDIVNLKADSMKNFSISVAKEYPNSISKELQKRFLIRDLNDVPFVQKIIKREEILLHQNNYSIKGKINSRSQSKLAGQPIILTYLDSTTNILTSYTNNEGQFEFYDVPQNAKHISVQPNNEDDELYISLSDNYDPAFFTTKNYRLRYFLSRKSEYLENIYINSIIKSKFNNVGYQTVSPSLKGNDSFYSKTDFQLFFKNFIQLDSLKEYFHELISVARVYNDDIYIFNNTTQSYYNNSPILFIDGVFIPSDKDFLNYPVNHCNKIDILQSKVFFNGLEYDGAIMLYTKKQSTIKSKLLREKVFSNYLIEDSLMKYESPIKSSIHTPDFRNTILWKESTSDYLPIIKLKTSEEDELYIVHLYYLNSRGKLKTRYWKIRTHL